MSTGGGRARVLVAFAVRLIRLWGRTLRFTIDDRAGIMGSSRSEALITPLWHNRLLLMPYVMKRFQPGRRSAGLISASRDGDWLALMTEKFGFETVRGSSSRRGAGAVLKSAEVLGTGGTVVLTPDGPRGPVYQLSPGIILLAQKSGAPVVPIHMEFSSCWRLKSWDRFIVPHPFSKVRVIFGPRHVVAPTSDDATFEAERARLQAAMMQLVERP